MDRVKIGLIGLGRWGDVQLSALSTLPYVDVVAVCSRSEERCRQICKKYGIKKYYLDFQEIIQDPQAKAIIVSTEPERHVQPILLALEAGKDVLAEKPLALALEEIDRIIQEAREKGVIFMVAHTLRFDIRYELLKERIKKGELGKIVSIYSRRNVWKGLFEQHAKHTPMLETGVHEIDLCRWYMEDEVTAVYARKINVLDPEVADTYWAVLTFSRGGIAVVETSWLLPDRAPTELNSIVEVIGSRGVAYIESPSNSMPIWTEKRSEYPDIFFWPVIDGHALGTVHRMLEYFARCVLKRELQRKVSFKDVRASIRIALAAVKSAEKGKEISL
jgi:UDP-N-acetylglucosamine 3-dehydrogenase